MVSQAALILRVITLWFLALSPFFRDGMDPFESRVPPDKFRVLHRRLHEIQFLKHPSPILKVFTLRLYFYYFFKDGMCPFKCILKVSYMCPSS